MDPQLSKHFRQARLAKELRLGKLAGLCGYRNLSKGARRIDDFEHGSSIQRDLLLKLADVLGIERTTVEALVEEDRRCFVEEWNAWASEFIQPYLVVRLMAAMYSPIDLPDGIESVEEAEAFAADFSKTNRLKSCLVLSRRVSVWFAEDGSVSNVTEATPGQPNSPYMRIGNRECVMKSVEHGLAVRQVHWPRKQEIRKTEPSVEPETAEVVTDFGGIRMKSSFEIVEDGPGQVTVNIEGPTIEFEEQVAWETTPDDLRTVLAAHGIDIDDDRVEELFAGLDCGAVEEAVLRCTDFDDQVAAMHNEIEDYLLKIGVVQGEKKFS
jgi:hypothetical protein